MAIPCPGCGREYDVALFAFGRTIHCTCGRRVGIEPRVRRAAGAPEAAGLRFAADAMLGRLARWLRVLGFDVSYRADVTDAELVRQAIEEDRWILTRDRALLEEWRVPRAHLVAAETPLAQLREVVDAFALAGGVQLFARCTRCNAPIAPLARELASGRVPPRVLATHERFFRCTGCDRVYWQGSHVDRMRRTLERVLGDASE